jgi:hypothetical protein
MFSTEEQLQSISLDISGCQNTKRLREKKLGEEMNCSHSKKYSGGRKCNIDTCN